MLHQVTLFQNIVCYCLSRTAYKSFHSFHIFQNIVCYCLSALSQLRALNIIISKHRMLLFIRRQFRYESDLSKFQNIVCYCLSFAKMRERIARHYFKTSYVTVYLTENLPLNFGFSISKHRMLLFIKKHDQYTYEHSNFKTSYVTVYQGKWFIVAFLSLISKHRMLLFIPHLRIALPFCHQYFKTSYVTVYRIL